MPKNLTQSLASELVEEAFTGGTLDILEQFVSHGAGPTIAALTAGGVAAGAGGLALPLGFVALGVLKIKDARKRERALQAEFAEIKRLVTLGIEGNLEAKTTLRKRLMENEPVDARLPGYEKADLAAYIESRLVPRVTEIAESLGMSIEEGFDGLRIYHQSHDRKLDAQAIDIGEIRATQLHNSDTLSAILAEIQQKHPSREEIEADLRPRLEAEITAKLKQSSAYESMSLQELAERSQALVNEAIEEISHPGFFERARDKGASRAILEGMMEDAKSHLDVAASHETAAVEKLRRAADWAYLTGEIQQAMQAVEMLLRQNPLDLYALARKGHICQTLGKLDDAKAVYQQTLSIAGDNEIDQAVAYGNLGNVLQTRGDLDGAEDMYRKSLEIEERLGRIEGIAINYTNLGNVLETRGDLDGAEDMYRKSLEIEERLGRIEGMASDYGNLGNVLLTRGDLDGAEDMYRKALELNERLGRIEGVASDYGNLGNVLATRGDLDIAEDMYRKALELNERLGDPEGTAIAYGNLGIVLKARGDLDAAEDMYRKSLELDERLGRIEGMANQYGNLGNVLATRGDLDGAEDMFRKSLELDERLGRLEGIASNYANLGNVLYIRGDLNGAKSHWMKARDLFKQLGAPHMVDKVQAMLDTLPPT